jgi:hypothetical protein
MTAPIGCRLVGRWRIVESDLWDRAHLDLVEPAMMTTPALARPNSPTTAPSRSRSPTTSAMRPSSRPSE